MAKSVKQLVLQLKDPDVDLCVVAIQALGLLGPAAIDAVPALFEALKDTDASLRYWAALALGEIDAVAIPVLIKALSDTDFCVRWGAASALGQFGPVAKDAVPALVERLNDSHEYVRRRASLALSIIEGS